jgi:hypothetical protein
MNLRTMFKRHQLGCKRFGKEWLRRWDALGKLLQKPSRVEFYDEFGDAGWHEMLYGIEPAWEALCIAIEEVQRYQNRVRVVLLDGTVVKEWGSS